MKNEKQDIEKITKEELNNKAEKYIFDHFKVMVETIYPQMRLPLRIALPSEIINLASIAAYSADVIEYKKD